jgi:hypothetical protein
MIMFQRHEAFDAAEEILYNMFAVQLHIWVNFSVETNGTYSLICIGRCVRELACDLEASSRTDYNSDPDDMVVDNIDYREGVVDKSKSFLDF